MISTGEAKFNSNGDALYTQRNQKSYRLWPITYRWIIHRVFIDGDRIQRCDKKLE